MEMISPEPTFKQFILFTFINTLHRNLSTHCDEVNIFCVFWHQVFFSDVIDLPHQSITYIITFCKNKILLWPNRSILISVNETKKEWLKTSSCRTLLYYFYYIRCKSFCFILLNGITSIIILKKHIWCFKICERNCQHLFKKKIAFVLTKIKMNVLLLSSFL